MLSSVLGKCRSAPSIFVCLTDFRDSFAQLANCHMPLFKYFLFLLHFCNCFGQNQRLIRTLYVMDICTSVHELSDPLSHIFDIHTLWPMGIVPLALQKRISASNPYLAEETRGNSIMNSCPVKTECCSRLGFMGI